jgi:beta-phosphoglucomutase-like phosphatase (HAD superfamily)
MAPRKDDPASAPQLKAVLFDMDGVITDTAEAHMAAWKRLFDEFLRERRPESAPFSAVDYRRHVSMPLVLAPYLAANRSPGS